MQHPNPRWQRDPNATPFTPAQRTPRFWHRLRSLLRSWSHRQPHTDAIAIVKPFRVENGFIVGDYEGKPLFPLIQDNDDLKAIRHRLEQQRVHRYVQHTSGHTITGTLPIPPHVLQRRISARPSPIAQDMQDWHVEPLPDEIDISWLNDAKRPGVVAHEDEDATLHTLDAIAKRLV